MYWEFAGFLYFFYVFIILLGNFLIDDIFVLRRFVLLLNIIVVCGGCFVMFDKICLNCFFRLFLYWIVFLRCDVIRISLVSFLYIIG